ncbi:unnamed protein product [Thelazia callipaeda]|uniref:Secreted protein n=1 Tax=Thelazia callipaeda TaxID=103827 RepID=A0A0N5DBY2_THECL|nr:unnamed protein product [Thelazia callipaeda]
MWRQVSIFSLLIPALDRIPALWQYLSSAQICRTHRFRFVLVESILIVERDAFERFLKHFKVSYSPRGMTLEKRSTQLITII